MPAVGQQTIVDKTGLAHKRPLSVLLIEDSPLIRRSLVEAQRFDAVIVDLQLKRGSGVEVLAYLQRTGMTDSAFAAVLTNHALPAYRERCLQYGVRHFFDKSLEFDRVLDALHHYARTRD